MKFLAAIIFALLCTFSVSAQKNPPKGYHEAPSLSTTGDFDGDGKPDTLTQFITDSLGRPIPYFKDEFIFSWDEYVIKYGSYNTAVALHGVTDTLTFKGAQGAYLFINVGNLNNTKGDEIAIIPDLVDQSRHSYCHIYSLCKGTWQEVFVFNVHEDAFDYIGETVLIYETLTGILEKKEDKWVYHDYLDMEYDNPDDVGKMMPLKVDNCE